MCLNIEIPDDEIDISDSLLKSGLDNWEQFEEHLVEQLDLEKEE